MLFEFSENVNFDNQTKPDIYRLRTVNPKKGEEMKKFLLMLCIMMIAQISLIAIELDLNDRADSVESDINYDDKTNQSKEIIFAADFIGDQQENGYNNNNVNAFQSIEMEGSSMFGIAGWSMLVPNLKVYETWDAGDYRRKVSMSDTTMLRDSTRIDYTQFLIPRPHTAKYNRFNGSFKDGEAGWRSDHNQVIFRYAEVLLIAA